MEWYAIVGIIAAYLLIGSLVAVIADRVDSYGLGDTLFFGVVTLSWPLVAAFGVLWGIGRIPQWIAEQIEQYEQQVKP